MASRRSAGIVALGLLLVAAGAVGYVLWHPARSAPIVGIVRATEVRVSPEVGGQLAAINVQKGDRVHGLRDGANRHSRYQVRVAFSDAREMTAIAVRVMPALRTLGPHLFRLFR
jgi:HlyD family secretion protein